MSSVADYPTKLQGMTTGKGPWLWRVILRYREAYRDWRIEQAAMAQLGSMSDRELRDIGLSRSDITFRVKGSMAGKRAP
jgi:uncharacterized protein YjiS (DUF1127 family)